MSRWRTPRKHNCPTATSSRGCSARSITIGRRVRSPGASNTPACRSSGPSSRFPSSASPACRRKQIRGFAELDFIAKAENIVFIGPTGVGKTGLASGLLLKAIQNGYRGRFIRAQDLFDEMYASLADRSTRKLLNTLDPHRRLGGRRAGLRQSETGADQHLLQADGGAVPPTAHGDHDEPGLPRLAQLPRQQGRWSRRSSVASAINATPSASTAPSLREPQG